MTEAALVDPSDRLPWLSEAKRPQPATRRSAVAPALGGLMLGLVIAGAGWAILDRRGQSEPQTVRTIERVALPAPEVTRPRAAEPETASVAEKEALQPVAEPVETPAKRRAEPKPRTTKKTAKPPAAASSPEAATPAYEPRAWQSGVPGRIIQVGAFRTAAQANAEWRRVYYRYPLLRPLPPRVVRSRIRGQTFYRLQLGTFSQAHSELLCQRLRAIGEGCIVLGLPKRRSGR